MEDLQREYKYYTTRTYGITNHFLERLVERFFDGDLTLSNVRKIILSHWTLANLDFNLKSIEDGVYSFLDNYETYLISLFNSLVSS